MADTPKTRKEYRAALLGKTHNTETKIISLWGIDVELRQASLGDILTAQSSDDSRVNAVNMIIRYAYVPGTNEKIFEDADKDEILTWPFGKDIQTLQDAILELTGINIDAAEKDLEENPLKDS